jgi:hypothetical protein
MIFDLITYGLLASVFVVNILRMFVEKPKNALQTNQLPWQRLLLRRSKSDSETSNF